MTSQSDREDSFLDPAFEFALQGDIAASALRRIDSTAQRLVRGTFSGVCGHQH